MGHPTFQHPRPSFEADKSGAAGDSVLLDLMSYLEMEASWHPTFLLQFSVIHTDALVLAVQVHAFFLVSCVQLQCVAKIKKVTCCQVLPREDVRFAAGNLPFAPRLGMSDTNLSQPWSLPRCGSNLAASLAVAPACGGMNPYTLHLDEAL